MFIVLVQNLYFNHTTVIYPNELFFGGGVQIALGGVGNNLGVVQNNFGECALPCSPPGNPSMYSKFMHLYHKQLLPPSFLHLFTTSDGIHSYNTRNANLYQIHSCKTTTTHNTFPRS